MITMLGTFILWSINPFVFITLISLLLFFEYVLAKSIIKDTGIVDFGKISKSVKQYNVKYGLLISYQWNIAKKKLINSLINNGNSFSFAISYKYIRQRIYHVFH